MEVSQEDAIYIIIGDAIRIQRRKANMTQQELAHQLGLLRTSISNIEAGRQHLPIHTLCAIAALFHVPVSTLFQEVSPTSEGQEYAEVNMQLRLEIIGLREQVAKIRTIALQDECIKVVRLE
jgi:DNA-binding XRE family transcriptional regulator